MHPFRFTGPVKPGAALDAAICSSLAKPSSLPPTSINALDSFNSLSPLIKKIVNSPSTVINKALTVCLISNLR